MSIDTLGDLTLLIARIAECCGTAAECAEEARALLERWPASGDAKQTRRNHAVSLPMTDDGRRRAVADNCSMTVRWRGKTCPLAQPTLFRLFVRLLRRPNTYVSYDQLMADVWDGMKADDTIRSAVRHLKARLREAGMGDLAAAIQGRNHHYVLLLDPPQE